MMFIKVDGVEGQTCDVCEQTHCTRHHLDHLMLRRLEVTDADVLIPTQWRDWLVYYSQRQPAAISDLQLSDTSRDTGTPIHIRDLSMVPVRLGRRGRI